MTTIVMSVEGVLTDHPPTDTMLNYEATEDGRTIFNILKPTARIILLSSDPYVERVKAWLVRERIIGYSMVYSYPLDSPASPSQWRIDKMKEMMAIGHHLGLYVDSDPHTIGQAQKEGVTSLLVAYPQALPGARGLLLHQEYAPTPWYDLVKQVDEQNMTRAERAQRESERAEEATV